MAKVKVGDLAKRLGLTVKELLKILKDLKIEAKTAASSVEEETAKIVKDLLKSSAEKAEKKEAKEKKPVKKIEKAPPAAVSKPVKAVPPHSAKTLPPPVPVPKPIVEPPPAQKVVQAPPPVPKIALEIDTPDILVRDLSDRLGVKTSDLIKELMKKKILVTINQRISSEVAKEVAAALGKEIVVKIPAKAEETFTAKASAMKSENLKLRPPVVTIMGHVDHGKTKLLDSIRKTKVMEGEAGGITQHIGAYQVEIKGKKITFLDTPGHEAFTSLRARGAKVTDVAVLVVAADDGVMPQTIEAIDHAKAAGVPIIVAVNKIDKPGVNVDRVKQQLSDVGLIPEDWGGQTVMVPTSAKQGMGIDELLEMILLVAEIQELKADPAALAEGIVIESRLDKGRGPVATVLIKNGTLRVGDVFSTGVTYGKVRALLDEKGGRIDAAPPATPVAVLGCVEVPAAGDLLRVVDSEKEAKLMAEQKKEVQEKIFKGKILSLEDFSKGIKEGQIHDLNLIIKADVQGSLDALQKTLQNLMIGNLRVNIIHYGIGAVTESDVMLAKASDAIIVGFNVGYEGKAESLGSDEGVEIRFYDIIYKLVDDVKLAMEGMLEPEYEEVVTGHAEVRNLFKFSKVGTIAGCFVTDGKMVRGAKIKIFRSKTKLFEGKLDSLKRFKDDVKTVEQNFECGIAILNFNDFEIGDVIENIEIKEKARGK